MDNLFSVVQYYSNSNSQIYSCGYCKRKDAYKRYGLWAHTLTVLDYQKLIDRGWRRSGSYCYKPMKERACCPMYTIRCEALYFNVTKSQRKVINKIAKFLNDGNLEDENKRKSYGNKHIQAIENDEICNETEQNYEYGIHAQTDIFDSDKMVVEHDCDNRLAQSLCVESNSSSTLNNDDEHNTQFESMKQDSFVNKPINENTRNKSILVDEKKTDAHNRMSESDSTFPRKAKLIRIERAKKRLLKQGKTLEEIEIIYKKKKEQSKPKNIEELLNNIVDGKNKLELKLVRVFSEEFMNTLDESVELFKKYQTAVHNDKPHENDKDSFLNFLGKSPLQSLISDTGIVYGSFHQQYWLNNKLMAIGVIDILPFCVSSVYFFYDPTYSFLSLGTFSSLIEIRLTRELNKKASDLQYYYMGYYIHSIPKMKYKAKMRPSKLLCPITYRWFDFNACIPKLAENKYSRLNDDPNAIDEDGTISPADLMQVRVFYRGRRSYQSMRDIRLKFNDTEDDSKEVKEYAKLVGKKCAHSMYLARH